MSHKQIVAFSGTIKNDSDEAQCTVMATKVTLPGTGVFAYGQYSVHTVSKSLPVGNYQLTVNGETIPVRHINGAWLAAI
jgi:hypothetical protein